MTEPTDGDQPKTIADLREALSKYNNLPEGKRVDYGEAVEYLDKTGRTMSEDDIAAAVAFVEGLVSERDNKSKEGKSNNNVSVGQEGAHASMADGVEISRGRRNSFSGNKAVRGPEEVLIAKQSGGENMG